jgi:hypothetical protein
MDELLRLRFSGIQLRESVTAVADGEPYWVKRTWRERLLSWPWRPWNDVRMIVPKVPAAYRLWDGSYLVHPDIASQLRAHEGTGR